MGADSSPLATIWRKFVQLKKVDLMTTILERSSREPWPTRWVQKSAGSDATSNQPATLRMLTRGGFIGMMFLLAAASLARPTAWTESCAVASLLGGRALPCFYSEGVLPWAQYEENLPPAPWWRWRAAPRVFLRLLACCVSSEASSSSADSYLAPSLIENIAFHAVAAAVPGLALPLVASPRMVH